MKKNVFPLLTPFVVLLFFLQTETILGQEATTYYLIRHAEKDLSNKTNDNPHLTAVGKQRANAWKTIFQAVAFDKIYSTNYYRTLETATPVAEDKGLPIVLYDSKDSFSSEFRKATQGKTVLVVGHSNTIPFLANAILGEERYSMIDDEIHGNLYLLQLVENTVSCQLLVLE